MSKEDNTKLAAKMKCDPKILLSVKPTKVDDKLAEEMKSLAEREIFEIQVFGFSSTSVRSGVIETFCDVVDSVLEDTGKKFSKKFDPELVSKVIEELGAHYCNTYYSYYKKIKEIIEQQIALPPDFLPAHFAHNLTTYTAEFEDELDQKIANAENRYKANAAMLKALEKELNKYKQLNDLPKEVDEIKAHVTSLQEEALTKFLLIQSALKEFEKQSTELISELFSDGNCTKIQGESDYSSDDDF